MNPAEGEAVLCPSAPPEWKQSVAFGVVGGSAAEPRLRHLPAPLPVTPELLALRQPVRPTEVFRFAAPCAGHGCVHFQGDQCKLVQRIVRILPAVAEAVPPCLIRPTCRWWKQEGKSACFRCPQIVTDNVGPSEEMARAYLPGAR